MPGRKKSETFSRLGASVSPRRRYEGRVTNRCQSKAPVVGYFESSRQGTANLRDSNTCRITYDQAGHVRQQAQPLVVLHAERP
jgi:ribosomal protein S14